MSKWTINEYQNLPTDANGNAMPISTIPLSRTGMVGAGQVNLSGGRYVRFCGDTNAHVRIGDATNFPAGTSDEFVPAGQDYWLDPGNVKAINFIVG